MSFTQSFRACASGHTRTWMASACLLLAACGGERPEPVAATPALQEVAGLNAEGEVVRLKAPAGAEPRAVSAGQACGMANEGGRQPVCEAGSYCVKASNATTGTCMLAQVAPRNE